MSLQVQSYIHTVLSALATVNGFAKAITNSPVSGIVSGMIPVAGQVLAILKEVEGGVDAIEAATPLTEKLVPMIFALAQIANLSPSETAELLQRHIDEAHKTEG